MSDSLWPHGHSTPGFPDLHYLLTIWASVCSNSCPLSWYCYHTISSSSTPYSYCFWSFKYQGLFQWVTGNLYHLIDMSSVPWPTVLDNHHSTLFLFLKFVVGIEEECGVTVDEYGISFRDDWNVLKLIKVMATWLNILKNEWIVYSKCVNFLSSLMNQVLLRSWNQW